MISILLAIIYLAFVSLGLPDALLGAAWPTLAPLFGVEISYMGIISALICCGTITSSLLSDRLTRKFGVGIVTAVSVGTTAIALLAFSMSSSFWMICLFAIPYGLGAGGVDAALNNYVALHYSSSHMSWLHCMWGVGASIGPYIMAYALTGDGGWQSGYMYVFYIQAILTAILICSLPLWKKVANTNTTDTDTDNTTASKPLSIRQILNIPGTKPLLVAFFCYCAIESTVGMYASSYLVTYRNLDTTTAALWASWYYIGITVGRAISGFVTLKLSDNNMIRLGLIIMTTGLMLILLPLPIYVAMVGLILTGLGSAPIYPCIIHSTPYNFGRQNSQAITGVQMACAYIGSLVMPPLFGIIAQYISIALYPIYLLLLVALMAIMMRIMIKLTTKARLAQQNN